MARIISLIRYRFFLFAGIFPYVLGQILAYHIQRSLKWDYCWLGFLGIFLALIGVELFNEYFDSSTTLTVNPEQSRRIDAQAGGDRTFLKEKPNIPSYFLLLALCSMLFAFFIGLYLTSQTGWPILLFSLLGFLAAYFYVGPPLRWAYRGWGELVITLSYGPFMVLGSYYLQTKRIDVLPIFVSFILGLLIFSLAIANEIPDYYQDKLVGKRNLVVKLGRQAAVKLFGFSVLSVFCLLGLGIAFRLIPYSSAWAFFMLPLVLKSIKIAQDHYDAPGVFLPAIRATLFTYIIMVSLLGISYLLTGGG